MRLSISLAVFCYCLSFFAPATIVAQNLTFQIEETTVKMGEEMCVDVMVNNFDLIGFQFTISWDSTVLDYSRVINPKVPYFLQSTYQDFPDMFRVAWINESILSSIILPDNSPVFTLCFTPKKTGYSTLYFDKTIATPLHPEFINLDGILDATLIDGNVTVLGCTPSTTTIDRTICSGDTFERYTQTGQFTDAFTTNDGCDSTRILNLTVLPSIQQTIKQTVCAGSSFEGYAQTGRYTDIFKAYTGCDSIRVLDLTVVPAITSSITQTICAGGSFEGYQQEGQYSDTFTAASGCDSTRTLFLTVTSSIETTESVSICEGENFGGRVLEGTYVDTYTSSSTGCDSTRTLFLSVIPTNQTAIIRSICENACISMGGTEFCQAGTYEVQLTSANGCDSLVQLTVQVVTQMQGTSSVRLCPGEFWIEGGTALDEAGSYNFMYTSSTGCDSLHTLELAYFEEPLNTASVLTICEGENFGGRTVEGVYTDNYTSSNGCDSTHTITLTVLTPIERTEEVSICQGQTYQGYSQSGLYVDTFTASNSCDSIRTLQLTVSNIIRSTITATICEGENFEGLTAAGVYENSFIAASGCDSIRTLTLTVLPQVATIMEVSICRGEEFEGYTNAGTYTNIFTSSNGCDSVRSITLNILPDNDISCQSTPTIDIDPTLSVSIYPNPIQTNVFIEWSRAMAADYTIIDASGKVLLSTSSDTSLSSLDLSHLLAGVYYLQIQVEGRSHYAKLLKL